MTRFEQPTFATNFLTFEIKPSPDGGLTDSTKAEVRFKDRAMFEFVSLLEKSRERAIYMRRQIAEDEEGLREYCWLVANYCRVNLPVSSHVYDACGIKYRIDDRWYSGREPSELRLRVTNVSLCILVFVTPAHPYSLPWTFDLCLYSGVVLN